MVWHETAMRLSTDDGRPLDTAAAAAAGVRFEWHQLAELRLRRCLAVDAPAGERHPRHLLEPGQADLTLKLKGIDPGTFPAYDRDWRHQVCGSRRWGGSQQVVCLALVFGSACFTR